MKLPSTPKFAIRFALIISLVLAILKAVIGFLSGSLAILGSALDSFMDMFVSSVNAGALWLSEKDKTRNYSYGLGKVQGFAAIFEGSIVLGSGLFLGYNGIVNFTAQKHPEISGIEISAMILAILGTILIMWNFLRVSKIQKSLLIQSDALHYSSDLVMNIGILLALILTKFFGLWWTDSIFAIAIALWILKNALPILWNGINMLLDRSLSEEEIKEIDSLLKSEKGLESYHFLKTRRSGDDIFIEAHIVFRDKKISLQDAHNVSESLESALGARFLGATITLHLDTDPEPEVCPIHNT
ncbi:MAG: cation diffusion facilitator family transporter [Candidatus Altimarinota bacterium]